MQKDDINYRKKMAKLRYKDQIIAMHDKGESVRKITQKINYSLSRSILKCTISKSSIHNIITEYKKKSNM